MAREQRRIKELYGLSITKITVGNREDAVRIVLDNGDRLQIVADRYHPGQLIVRTSREYENPPF